MDFDFFFLTDINLVLCVCRYSIDQINKMVGVIRTDLTNIQVVFCPLPNKSSSPL